MRTHGGLGYHRPHLDGADYEEAQKILEGPLADPGSPRLTTGVPDACQKSHSSAEAFRIRRGAQVIETGELELSQLLAFVKDKPHGKPLKALADVRVTMLATTTAKPLPASPPMARSG